MDPRKWQVLREGLIESYRHRDVAGATCCVCGASGVPMAARIIDYAFPVGAKAPDGFISASSSVGTIRGGFPVCVVCAPPCGRCGMPVRTKRVRARFAELSKRLHSSNSPLAWGNGSCDHLWHWSRLELLGIVRLPEPELVSQHVPRRPAVPVTSSPN